MKVAVMNGNKSTMLALACCLSFLHANVQAHYDDSCDHPSLQFVNNTPSVCGNQVTADFLVENAHLVSSIFCSLKGPGRTPAINLDCSSGHVRFSDLPLRRQQFTLNVTAVLAAHTPATLLLAQQELRLDHDVCWLHPVNRGITINSNGTVFIEWQGTGPTAGGRVTEFLCRRDRERTETRCASPYVWSQPCPLGSHTLSVRPALSTTRCRRHITRRFTFNNSQSSV